MVRNFWGQPRRPRIVKSPSRLTVSKALVRSRKETHFLFSAFLLYLPHNEDHVYGPSVGPEPTLAFWRVFLCYRQDEPIQQGASQDNACNGE